MYSIIFLHHLITNETKHQQRIWNSVTKLATYLLSIKQLFVIFISCNMSPQHTFLSFNHFYDISYLGLFPDPFWFLSILARAFPLICLFLSDFFFNFYVFQHYAFIIHFVLSVLIRCFLLWLNAFQLIVIHHFILFSWSVLMLIPCS